MELLEDFSIEYMYSRGVISTRLKNACANNWVQTFGELLSYTEEQIGRWRGVGKGTVQEFNELCERYPEVVEKVRKANEPEPEPEPEKQPVQVQPLHEDPVTSRVCIEDEGPLPAALLFCDWLIQFSADTLHSFLNGDNSAAEAPEGTCADYIRDVTVQGVEHGSALGSISSSHPIWAHLKVAYPLYYSEEEMMTLYCRFNPAYGIIRFGNRKRQHILLLSLLEGIELAGSIRNIAEAIAAAKGGPADIDIKANLQPTGAAPLDENTDRTPLFDVIADYFNGYPDLSFPVHGIIRVG